MESMKAAFLIMFLVSFDSSASSQSDSCAANLSVGNLIPFNTSSLTCVAAWTSEGYILRYARAGPSLWSFVLSAPDSGAYIAIGFSTSGRMVGSSALAGWKAAAAGDGAGGVKQYYLGGYSSSQCPPDQGSLAVVQGTKLLVSQGSRLYLAFQLSTAQPETSLIYAVGPRNGLPSSGGYLDQHRSTASGTLTVPTGGGGGGKGGGGDGDDRDDNGEETPSGGERGGEGGGESSRGGDTAAGLGSGSGGGSSFAKGHALLSIVGWGILIPTGVAMARYLKHYDALWLYVHVSVQGIGFIVGVIGDLTGFKLEKGLNGSAGHIGAHKTLGIVILLFGCLQVTAILARPSKESKVRKHWNWCHHFVGRAAIACAAANIFYGLALAKASKGWSYGYGIFLGIWLVVCLVFEEWRRKHVVDCPAC